VHVSLEELTRSSLGRAALTVPFWAASTLAGREGAVSTWSTRANSGDLGHLPGHHGGIVGADAGERERAVARSPGASTINACLQLFSPSEGVSGGPGRMICLFLGLGKLPVVRVVVPEPFHTGGMKIFLVDVVAIVCKCKEEEALKKLEAVTGNEDPAMKYHTMKHQDRWLCGDGTACKHFIMKLPFTSQQAAGKHCESMLRRELAEAFSSYLM